MTDIDLAKTLLEHLKGGKLVDFRVQGGPVSTFVLVFETDDERIGTLSFQPAFGVDVQSNQVTVTPKVNIGVNPYQK